MPWCQVCSATSGLSRRATAQALGGFMISAVLPATNILLLLESSHDGASVGRYATSCFQYSSAFLTLSLLTVMSPLAFTSSASKPWKMAPQVSTESAVVPSPMPKGTPALWQAAAALRKVA